MLRIVSLACLLLLPAGKANSAEVSDQPMTWHKVTLTIDGPEAKETDTKPNPFIDYRMTVKFIHESGNPKYVVPGYFAADGQAAETSADSGSKWRAHVSPDEPGKWFYEVSFVKGEGVAVDEQQDAAPVDGVNGITGSFNVLPTDKIGRDFRSEGRLAYVDKHYLQFAGSKRYFLKAGPDAPETLLAYQDFDGTRANRKDVPLKTWRSHIQDWRKGDPTWQDGKGKGLIGAINYLSAKGCNSFSFLPYNAGGDGDNVWPFVERNDKLHYDCSKLDQWQVVFDHAQSRGVFLHYKLQETEMDDDNLKGKGTVPTALDNGDLGLERKLYCREMVARFSYELALNWNLGEENTQTAQQQREMAAYLKQIDPYDHLIVIHTYPDQQDKVYAELLGSRSELTGASLQNPWNQAHARTRKWVKQSREAGRPWVVANDEQNPAGLGVPPDAGYRGFSGKAGSGKQAYDRHDIRRQTLWGTLLAGGAGVEYYFGYKLPQNDLLCEDFRSRDRAWDDCRIALQFFKMHSIPFWEMKCVDELTRGGPKEQTFCFAQVGEIYLVLIPNRAGVELDLNDTKGAYSVHWFNPREGGDFQHGNITSVEGGSWVSLGAAPSQQDQDWLVIIRK